MILFFLCFRICVICFCIYYLNFFENNYKEILIINDFIGGKRGNNIRKRIEVLIKGIFFFV